MGQMRTATRSILLSDDSSRLLLQARSIMRASAPSAMAIDEDVGGGRSTTMTTKMMPPRKKAPNAQQLEMAFRCPFCNRHGSVECRIDHKGRVAEVSCWACQASYSTAANALTEPVDVYGEWIDECELGDCDGDIAMVDACDQLIVPCP